MAIITGAEEQAPAKDKFSPRSAFIELVEYDRAAATMTLHFKSGSARRYLFCFPATFETFKQSPSHDAYFSKAIKGRLVSVSLKDKNIGRDRSHPLKAAKKRRTLDNGIRKQPDRVAGTVARAGL